QQCLLRTRITLFKELTEHLGKDAAVRNGDGEHAGECRQAAQLQEQQAPEQFVYGTNNRAEGAHAAVLPETRQHKAGAGREQYTLQGKRQGAQQGAEQVIRCQEVRRQETVQQAQQFSARCARADFEVSEQPGQQAEQQKPQGNAAELAGTGIDHAAGESGCRSAIERCAVAWSSRTWPLRKPMMRSKQSSASCWPCRATTAVSCCESAMSSSCRAWCSSMLDTGSSASSVRLCM